MAIDAGAPSGRNDQSQFSTGLSGAAANEWADPEREPRDLKKIVLIIGLGALSWAATYIGMLELIQANVGDLPLLHKALIGFSVAMLMTMIIWLLDQIFSPAHVSAKFFFILGYIFLTVISVGFGFGFYWKVLESRSESTRSAESAISGVQNSLHAGFTRMTQLNQTLKQLEQISTAKAVEEREKGTSCPNSRPGDGPRRKLRDADAASFRFASEFVSRRVGSVKTDLSALDADLKKVASRDSSTIDPKSGTRNKFLRDLNRRLDLTVTGFNAFRTDPQLRQIRSDLNDRAGKTVFPNGNRTFKCPDQQLQAALRGVVRAIDQLPQMHKPQIAAVEGSEATIEAFRRLTASIFGVLTLTPPLSPDDLRQLQKKAIQSVSGSGSPAAATAYAPPTGLGKRDYVPLAIAIFVDLCLLLVSIGRPMNRLNNLIPKMREAEKGPVIQILSRFNEIHADPEIRKNFEVFHHVVFDYLGDYYVAVPLDTPYNRGGGSGAPYYGSSQAQDLQHEAHLLANLFASFEQEKIFKRVYFIPTRTVRARLNRQGSKFAGSTAFRLYRFKEGVWSDIILGAVMGAAKRVEAEKAERLAQESQQREERGPALNPAKTNSDKPLAANGEEHGPVGRGEVGPSGKTPNVWLGGSVGSREAQRTMNGYTKAGNGAGLSASATNGNAALNGTNGHSVLNGLNGGGGFSASASAASAPNVIYIEENFDDDELDDLLSEDEDQIRSRYGKYAEKILAERTQSPETEASAATTESDVADDSTSGDALPNLIMPELKTPAANSNTVPAAVVQIETTPRANEIEQDIEVASKSESASDDEPKVIPLPLADANADNQNATGPVVTPTESATVTLTRETATYTVPVSEAVLPASLQKAVAEAQPVILSQVVLNDEPEISAHEVIAQPNGQSIDEPILLTPPPLPKSTA